MECGLAGSPIVQACHRAAERRGDGGVRQTQREKRIASIQQSTFHAEGLPNVFCCNVFVAWRILSAVRFWDAANPIRTTPLSSRVQMLRATLSREAIRATSMNGSIPSRLTISPLL